MTWRELKSRIERMSAEEQNKMVTVWAEEKPFRDVTMEQCPENLYGNNDWDFAVYESDCNKEELNDPGTYLIARKGHYYLEF